MSNKLHLAICMLIPVIIFAGKLHADEHPIKAADQQVLGAGNAMLRRYTEGEKLTYLMKGLNEDWRYEIQGNSMIKRDPTGAFFEEYRWLNLVSNHGKTLSPVGLAFRHELSLDPRHKMVFPNLAQATPVLIGPVTDMLTFYSDALMVLADPNFSHAGDHKYVKWGGPNSWADGTYVVLGPDVIVSIVGEMILQLRGTAAPPTEYRTTVVR